LNRQAARPEFDVHAFGRMAVAIELIAQDGDGHRQRADDKIKDVGAGSRQDFPSTQSRLR
jgi:hypothetical protein